jgi:hypothetical protein
LIGCLVCITQIICFLLKEVLWCCTLDVFSMQ